MGKGWESGDVEYDAYFKTGQCRIKKRLPSFRKRVKHPNDPRRIYRFLTGV
jgi:hypothetical protein